MKPERMNKIKRFSGKNTGNCRNQNESDFQANGLKISQEDVQLLEKLHLMQKGRIPSFCNNYHLFL